MQVPSLLMAALISGLLFNPAVFAAQTGQTIAMIDGIDELSPALMSLMQNVLDNNPRVHAARAMVDAASARGRAASQSIYNPELEFEVERAESDTTKLGLRQAIDWSDKRAARSGVAAEDYRAAQAELEVVQQALANELLSSIATYHTAQALHALAQERATLMQRFLALAETRQRAGDLTQVELELARLAHTQAVLYLAQAAALRADAEQALTALTGEHTVDVPALPEQLPVLAEPDLDSLPEQLPDLRAGQARIAAAREGVSLRQREQRPDPTVGLQGGQEGSDQLVGLTLSIPLYVRNNFRAETQAASADLLQAEQVSQDALRRARARLTSSVTRYQITRTAWQAWEATGKPSLGSQVDLLERLWQAGELSTTDYLVQLNQTSETRTSAFELRGQLWQSWFEWLAASGRIGQLLSPIF